MRMVGLLFIIVPLLPGTAGYGQATQQIAIRLLDFDSGKPIKKLSLSLTFWNGNPEPDGWLTRNSIVREGSARTNEEGRIVVDVPRPVPEHLRLFHPDLTDPYSPDLSLAEALKSGIVVAYKHSTKGPTAQASSKQGEIVIFNKRRTAWERMRQEVP